MKCLGSRCQFPSSVTTITEVGPAFSLDNNPMDMMTQGITYPPSFGFKQDDNNSNTNKLRGSSS
jgi:hypothetical protein